MDKIEKIHQEILKITPTKQQIKPKEFKEVLKNFISEVNESQKKADEAIKKFVAGEPVDIHEVMIAAQEANINFQLMLELRNKLLAAYQEIMRTQV